MSYFLGLKLFFLADVDPKTRPFQLSNKEFARICYAYKILLDENPEIGNYDFRQQKAVV